MESVEEKDTSKKARDRPKSQTPNLFPSYIVAFSLKETYDDLITAQQMICNKKSSEERSPQESTNSITPTNSLKMFECEQADKLNQILEKSETKTTEEANINSPCDNLTNSMAYMPPSNSLNYLSDDISDASLITIEEKENTVIDLSEDIVCKNSINENAVRQECDSINEYTVKYENVTHNEDKESCEHGEVHEIAEKDTCFCEIEELTDKLQEKEKLLMSNNNNEDEKREQKNKTLYTKEEPEAIFMAAKNNRKYKKSKNVKGKLKNSVNIKQKNFKYKSTKKAIDAQIARFYGKKDYTIDVDQIQKELSSDEVSSVVSRTRVLHKITAKENLLEGSELLSFISDVGLNEFDNESFTSSLLSVKKSMVSNSSQNTLTQKASKTSSRNKNELCLDLIKISTENIPYKKDVINVAIAVNYKRSKMNTRDETGNLPSKEEKELVKCANLTSHELMNPLLCNLTSDSPTNFDNFSFESSVDTLVNEKSSVDVYSDKFVIARTSSDFTQPDESTITLKNNIDTVLDIEFESIDNTIKKNKPMPLETVISLDSYTKMAPSTSLVTPYEYDCNNVIVTNTLNNDQYQINCGKVDSKKREITKNILKKNNNQQKANSMNKTINLPNQADIKALLNENEVPQIKCAEESRHPSYMPEIWDRLVTTLDLAVKRLEENMVEKIIKDLKKFIVGHPLRKDIPFSENLVDVDVLNKQEAVKETKPSVELGLQCDLVKNTIIDQIMQKLSTDGPKIIEQGVVIKSLNESKLSKDFDVLKPPDVIHQIVTEKGDAVTVSSKSREVCKFRRLKMLVAGALNSVRENVFVITSVPTFFFVLLCVYGIVLLLVKPW